MPRLPRFVLPGHPQYLIQRGVNRQETFCTDQDYQFYLEKLHDGAQKYKCDIHAYVLMTNHVHLLVTPYTENSIGRMMQMLGRYYVQYFNYCYKRTGTLWEGRYKATLIDTEAYLMTCMRYIEQNPVRATGMVNHPAEYPWSSYRYNALGQVDELVTPHALYNTLGPRPEDRQTAYRQLFRARIAEQSLEDIRSATNKAWVLGDDYFRQRIEKQLSRRAAPKKRGGDRKSDVYRNSIKIDRY